MKIPLSPLGLVSMGFSTSSTLWQQQTNQDTYDKANSLNIHTYSQQQQQQQAYERSVSKSRFSSSMSSPISTGFTFASQPLSIKAQADTSSPKQLINRGATYLNPSPMGAMLCAEQAQNQTFPSQGVDTASPTESLGSLQNSMHALYLDSSLPAASSEYNIFESIPAQAARNASSDIDIPDATGLDKICSVAFESGDQMEVGDQPTLRGSLQSLLDSASIDESMKAKIPVGERRQRNGTQRAHEQRQAVKEQASVERKLARSSRMGKAQDLQAQRRSEALQKRRNELLQQQALEYEAQQWVLQQEAYQLQLQQREREREEQACAEPTRPRKRRQLLHHPYDMSEEQDRQREAWLLTGQHLLRRQPITYQVSAEEAW